MKTQRLQIEQIFLKEIENTGSSESELEEIRRSNEAILLRYPSAKMKVACEKKLNLQNKNSKSHAIKALHFPSIKTIGLLAAACLTLVIGLALLKTGSLTNTVGEKGIVTSTERAKGSGAQLFIYKKENKGASVLRSFSKVQSGDIIQLSYLASGQTYGAIISIDGNGIITRHFPDDGHMANSLTAGGEVPLPFSYQLDNAPTFERFILITSSRNFSVTSIINSIQQAGKFALAATSDLSGFLPSGAVINEILLLK